MPPDARPENDRPLPPLDLALVTDQLESAVEQVSALVAAIDPAMPVVGRWTAHEAAAHLATGMELYTDLVRGGRSPADTIDGIAQLNDDLIAPVGEAMRMLGDRIR